MWVRGTRMRGFLGRGLTFGDKDRNEREVSAGFGRKKKATYDEERLGDRRR